MDSTAPDRKPLVLVVDDEHANLGTFRRVFRGDFEIVLASSGAEAIATARATNFDCALVDYAMPEMNGLEVLTHLAAQNPAIARALLTAHFDRPDVVAAKASGLVEVLLQKPWAPDQIVGWVLDVVRRRAAP